MEHFGIDLGEARSQLAWVTDDGEIRQQRIRTTMSLLIYSIRQAACRSYR